jgi:hypothetical protein
MVAVRNIFDLMKTVEELLYVYEIQCERISYSTRVYKCYIDMLKLR